MANPKRRFSQARTSRRFANWKLNLPGISLCPQCKHPRLSHTVCSNCGFYNNKLIISQVTKEFREKRKERKKEEMQRRLGGPPPEEKKKD
ncbi:TPA: 50S ribosomal protein L32 [bacterium]|nr:50S ribosomal protein L32 [bacterium]